MDATQIEQLKRRATTGRYEVHGDPEQGDCVVGFSFGFRGEGPTITPGLSNVGLARFARMHYPRLPKLFQWEIADAYPDDGTVILVIRHHRQLGAYLHTREVAEQIKTHLDQQGWAHPIVLAHGHHMPRADAICRKLGLLTIVPSGLAEIPFDPDSSQEWTPQRPAVGREGGRLDRQQPRAGLDMSGSMGAYYTGAKNVEQRLVGRDECLR